MSKKRPGKYHELYMERVRRGQSCKSIREPVECICPRCRDSYMRNMFWTGRGVPRIYCPTCVQSDPVTEGDVYYKNPSFVRTVKID
jgi:hypothetical protein